MSKPIDHNSPIPERNIVLVGMMGCGKSTVARSLAKLLTYPMVDTDQHISSLEKREITDIFKIKGEAYFRQSEHQLIESLVETKIQKHIISTGGGLPTQTKTRDLLPRLGYVVWF